MMKIRNSSLYVDDKKISSGISFSVSPGEIVGIVAKSGFGKTCIFRALMGEKGHRLDLSDNIDSSVFSYVPQKGGLVSWLTFEEHLNIFNVRCDLSELKVFGIERLINHKVKHLSGGEYHRVLLYLSSKLAKSYLILDEPFVSLDVLVKEKVKDWVISNARGKKIGILMASHDIDLLYSTCEKVFVFNGAETSEIFIFDCETEMEFRRSLLGAIEG